MLLLVGLQEVGISALVSLSLVLGLSVLSLSLRAWLVLVPIPLFFVAVLCHVHALCPSLALVSCFRVLFLFPFPSRAALDVCLALFLVPFLSPVPSPFPYSESLPQSIAPGSSHTVHHASIAQLHARSMELYKDQVLAL